MVSTVFSLCLNLVVPIVAIAISVPPTARAPAPTALTPSTTYTSPTVPLPSFATCVGRRAHKCEIDVDSLFEEFGLVGTVDGGARFLEGIEFDESVALLAWEAC